MSLPPQIPPALLVVVTSSPDSSPLATRDEFFITVQVLPLMDCHIKDLWYAALSFISLGVMPLSFIQPAL